MQSTTLASSSPLVGIGRTAHRVSLACLPCRSRHVKCDAAKPSCSRCIADDVPCNYTRSRRGHRHPKKQVADEAAAPLDANVQQDTEHVLLPSPTSSGSGIGTAGGSTTFTAPTSTYSENTQHDEGTVDEDLIGLYYTYFHASHPCALPRWAFQQHRTAHTELFSPILQTIHYIGSLFDPAVPSEPLKELALSTLPLDLTLAGTVTPHQLQAMLLMCIALYWCDEIKKSLQILDEVIRVAKELAMHQALFAVHHGDGDSVLEESWRRTWWQLYVTDGHIAGGTHTFPTRIGSIGMTTLLPCEEVCYESGDIPPCRSLEEYNMREFLPEEDPGFSSFAHLVGLTRTLDLVLSRNMPFNQNLTALCNQVDISLSAWSSLLPRGKRSLLDDRREIDVQLFKANMLVNTYLVDLHRQLSNLSYSDVESVARCGPPAPRARLRMSNSEDTDMHTSKAIIAIRRMSDLIHLPANIVKCSPFTICMIANTMVAHLSACRYIFRDRTLQLERERVRSSMGALRALGEYWPLGKRTYHEMGIIAREILALTDQDIPRPRPLARPETSPRAPSPPQDIPPDLTLDPDLGWFDFESLTQNLIANPCDQL